MFINISIAPALLSMYNFIRTIPQLLSSHQATQKKWESKFATTVSELHIDITKPVQRLEVHRKKKKNRVDRREKNPYFTRKLFKMCVKYCKYFFQHEENPFAISLLFPLRIKKPTPVMA